EQALNTAVIDAFDINWTRLNVAQALAMADDIEGAFEVLEMMLDSPSRQRSKRLRLDPLLANLRDDARFEPLMIRIDRVEPLN
ncbi:MAG: hypothetical protein V2J20_08840, partial [Wenzhouxiangella sp.]|nr:hypothetical protein [Wenzhouxiangella sp.]